MRVALVAAVLASACDSPPAQPVVPDARMSSCNPQEGPLCTDTCGNGVIEACQSKRSTEVCLDYVWTQEVCEGDSKSCTELGYFAGTAPCTSCSYYSTFECDPCPADAELCAPITSFGVATASSTSSLGTVTGGYLDVYDITGASPTRSMHVPLNDAAALTAVADGWIAVSNTLVVTHVSNDGTVGSPMPITDTNYINVVSATYAAGRVLVVWAATDLGVKAAIVDAASGAVVAGPFAVFAQVKLRPSLASDGASFFVASDGKLAKILTDGTIAATTSIGTGALYTAAATCAGTTCWYIAATSTSFTTFTAQRFDSNAAPVGAPITIAPGFALESFLADGNDLLALRITTDVSGPRFDLVRIDGSGSVIATKVIAAGSNIGKLLLRVGSRVAILFSSVGEAYVAVATP